MKLSIIESALAERIKKLEKRMQEIETQIATLQENSKKLPSVDLTFLDLPSERK